jgi:hypothetical protein
MTKRSTMTMISARLHAGARALPAALALVAFAPAPAGAAAPSPPPVAFALASVGATSSISLHGTPGRVLQGAVLVRNLSGHPVAVILQRADIRNSSNGDADYVTSHPSGTGRWLHLSAGRVRLAPHASRRVAYTASVPHAAAGGSHYAGIVAINAADLSAVAARGKATGRKFTFYRISRQALPLTIHLPGRLSRSLALRSVKLVVAPIGAGIVLGLLPGGSELTEQARVKLRVLRGIHQVFTYASTLGQMFPGGILNYRISWPGRPRQGTYHVLGTIRPQDSATIHVNHTITFTGALATRLARDTPPGTQPATTGTRGWMSVALGVAAVLLIALPTAVWKLARRPAKHLRQQPQLCETPPPTAPRTTPRST